MYQEITIQFTDVCNLECPYCFSISNGQFISIEDFNFFKIFCMNTKIDCVHITGGEPSLHPFFDEMTNSIASIYPIVLYSNMTYKSFDILYGENVFILANYNKRNCSKKEWTMYCNNIEIVQRSKAKVAIGLTLYDDNYIDDIKNVIYFCMDNKISHLRISQSVSLRYNCKGLDKHQVVDLYNFVSSNIHQWSSKGLKVYFDCPVPPCYIIDKDFYNLKNYQAISSTCQPKAFVTCGLRVTHCYSTMSDNMPPLQSFTDIDQIKTFSRKLILEKTLSRNCSNGCNFNNGTPCGCPIYNI